MEREDAGTRPDAQPPTDAGSTSRDSGDTTTDAGSAPDGGAPDAGAPDAGAPIPDAGGASCPAGSIMAVTDHVYCIEDFQTAPLPYFEAGAACSARGWDLCSGSEYDAACVLGLAYDADSWEWIKDMVSATEAEKRIPSACGDTAIHPVGDPYPFRCCMDL